MPIFTQKNIESLYISMDNIIIVEVVNSVAKLPRKVPYLFLREIFTFFFMLFNQLYALMQDFSKGYSYCS